MASTFRRKAGRGGGSRSSTTSSSSTSSSSSSASSSPLHRAFLRGTKPSTGGVTLTSTGLRDLDQILGGGQPLGTCILLEEDRWTRSLALTLLKYWCAQAVSHEQDLLIPLVTKTDDGQMVEKECLLTSLNLNQSQQQEEDENNYDISGSSFARREVESILQNLPSNLNFEKERLRRQQQQQTDTTPQSNDNQDDVPHSLDALQEEEDENDEDDENLKIAWQYKKDVQRERLGHDPKLASLPLASASAPSSTTTTTTDSSYCHSFDLQGRLSTQVDATKSARLVDIPVTTANIDDALVYFRNLERLLPRVGKTDKVVRLLLYQPDTTLLRTALPLLLSSIRQQKLPVVLLIALRPWQQQQLAATTSLRRTVDVVLQAEGFASRKEYPPPSEFRMFQGLLRIPKACTVTSATAHGGGHFADLTVTKRPASDLFGLKRDRRKLHIQLLHIPPEDYAEGGGSVGGGGVRSGAGRTDKSGSSTGGLGCASSGGGSSPLDF